MVSFFTLISRILGVIRDALIAMIFGTSIITDAFFIAFRPFDLVRKLLSEGTFNHSFIPFFSRDYHKNGLEKAIQLAFAFFWLISAVCVVVIVAGIFTAPVLFKWITPEGSAFSSQTSLTVFLFRVMLPYFWTLSVVALCMGILNSLGHFTMPALAPVVFNMVIIGFTLFFCNQFETPIKGLAFGVVVGGICQLLIQVPAMIRYRLFHFNWFHFQHSDLIRVLSVFIPCMIGASSYQINLVVASFFSASLSEGSVSFLYFSDRLVQFPLALFAVSLSTVFMPELSNRINRGDRIAAASIFVKGVKFVFFITIPAMAGLIVLDNEIVHLLFGRGKFDQIAISETARCLFLLATGLWAFAGTRVFVIFYYAMSSFRIPFYCGIISIVFNIILCHFLMPILGLNGIALSISLSAILGFIFLFLSFPYQDEIDKKSVLFSACRSFFLSAIMLFLVGTAAKLSNPELLGSLGYALRLMGLICFGIIIYLVLNVLTKNPDFKMAVDSLVKKVSDE